MRADVIREALLTHTLAHCATIQLHTPLVQDRVTANSRTFQAAHAAITNLNLRHLNNAPILYCMNPFNGVSCICTHPTLPVLPRRSPSVPPLVLFLTQWPHSTEPSARSLTITCSQ